MRGRVLVACTGITALASGLLAAPAASAPTTPSAPSALEGLEGPQIVHEAEQELAAAQSVRMDLTGDGIKLGLTLDRSGNCAGKADMGPGGSLAMVKHGSTVWLKPDRAFWASQLGPERAAEIDGLVDGRYIRGTTDDPAMGGMDATCDIQTLRNSIDAASGEPDGTGERSGGTGTWKREDDRRFRGHDTVTVAREHDGVTTRMSVADEKKPYPLELTRSFGGRTETIELGRYGEPVPGERPSAQDSVHISELQQAAGSGTDGTEPVKRV